jgi:hypothetical protein
LKKKYDDLENAFKDKSKAQAEITAKYNKLKAQTMAADVQDAASENAEETLLGATGAHFSRQMFRGTMGSNMPGSRMSTAIPQYATSLPAPRRNPGMWASQPQQSTGSLKALRPHCRPLNPSQD